MGQSCVQNLDITALKETSPVFSTCRSPANTIKSMTEQEFNF